MARTVDARPERRLAAAADDPEEPISGTASGFHLMAPTWTKA
jgi:hypothetical protein